MNPDHERDDLWELLGQAAKPEVSPFFARNVLREIRMRETTGHGLWQPRRWRLAAFAALGAAALMAMAGAVHIFKTGRPPIPAVELARQTTDKSDYEIIARLDFLLASENNSIWFENSSE